jgi:glycosyltransferase involved in cell wall biosynthesis
MSRLNESRPALTSLFLSQWVFNPYQKLLTGQLMALGVHVAERSMRKSFFRRALFRDKPDILHLQNIHPLVRRQGWMAVVDLFRFLGRLTFLKAAGIKIVWTAHELGTRGRKNARLERLGTILTGRIAHAVIAHCEKARAEVLRQPLLAKKKVFVVPHGHYIGYYDNEISRAQARTALSLPQESFVFLFFGWIDRYKGIAELIDAFERIHSDEAYLVIAGNLPESKFADVIHEKVAHKPKIKLVHRFIPENEIQMYLNSCDVVVLPYRDVLTSGAVILAMSFARPCVAVRRGCISDVLNESGAFLYEPHSPQGLLGAMERAMQNRNELAGMGRYNQERASQWGWDRVAEKTIDVYRSVVEGT